MADPFRYNFDVKPYEGDLTRYGFGPGHKWFDYYAPAPPPPPGGGGEEEEEDDDLGGGGPDGGGNTGMDDDRGRDQAEQPWSELPGSLMTGLSVLGGGLPAIATMGMRATGFDPMRDLFGFDLGSMFGGSQSMAGVPGLGISNGQQSMVSPELQGMNDMSQSDGWGGQTEGGFSNSGVEGDRGFLANGGRYRGGLPPPRMIRGPGDGRSDSVMANGGQVRVSRDEFVWPADVVSAIGRGSSDAGADRLGEMAQMIRQQHMTRMGGLPPPRS